MSNKNRKMHKPSEYKVYLVSASKTTKIEVGDAVWYDKANKVAQSAVDFPWQGTLLKTQRAFNRVFLGFSMDASPAATNQPAGTFINQNKIRVSKKGGHRLDFAAATAFEKDTFLGMAKHATNSKLLAQTVAVVTDLNAAVGRAMEADTATSVLFETHAPFDAECPLNQRTFLIDPGHAGAIPVGDYLDGFCDLLSAGVETRSVAAPTSIGQRLTISMSTDGGDLTLTVGSGAIDGTNNTAVFGDVGDTLILEAGADLKWKMVANIGTALSAV